MSQGKFSLCFPGGLHLMHLGDTMERCIKTFCYCYWCLLPIHSAIILSPRLILTTNNMSAHELVHYTHHLLSFIVIFFKNLLSHLHDKIEQYTQNITNKHLQCLQCLRCCPWPTDILFLYWRGFSKSNLWLYDITKFKCYFDILSTVTVCLVHLVDIVTIIFIPELNVMFMMLCFCFLFCCPTTLKCEHFYLQCIRGWLIGLVDFVRYMSKSQDHCKLY